LQITAAVIEEIIGKNFKQLIKEIITNPCEMSNTDFGNKPLPLPAGRF
jgi:CubicO group peptidase (beta-lactamase class C family)